MELATRRYRQALEAAAVVYRLPSWLEFTPAEWLEGLVLTESSGRPNARRYEPHQDRANRRDAAVDADTPDVDDGPIEDDASYGLMQVMGYNVRHLVGAAPGTRLDFVWVFDPWTAIGLGCRILVAELEAVGGNVERALAHYNGGPTGDDPVTNPATGQTDMRLRDYVRRVARNATAVQADKGSA